MNRAEKRILEDGIRTISWGDRRLPETCLSSHFMVVGTTGSGKTLTLMRLIHEFAKQIGQVPHRKALVYDPKGDLLPFIRRIGLKCPIHVINPFDVNGCYPDFAHDICDLASGWQLATHLIPEEHGHNAFFSDAARLIVYGVIATLNELAPGKWTFRDLILAAECEKTIRVLLSGSSEGRAVGAGLLHDPRILYSVVSTLLTRLVPFRPVAAAWSAPAAKLSLSKWTNEGNSVVVLSRPEEIRAQIDVVHRLVFRRLVELTLGQPDSQTPNTLFVLDEFREAGKLPGLSSLLTRVRSKGGSVALAFQSFEGICDSLGEDVAHEVTGLCGNKTLLRMESARTASWAADVIGESETTLALRSQSATEAMRTTVGMSEQSAKAHVVMPEQLMMLPQVSTRTGVSGYHLTPNYGAWKATTPWQEFAPLLAKPVGRTTEARQRLEQALRQWDQDDLERLGLDDHDRWVQPDRAPTRTRAR